MDEYVGLPATHPNSYARFMHENLFNHVDMDPANIHLLNGVADDLERECAEYEAKIAAVGGVELFLAGLGTDGHLAFNEPGSSLGSRTRVKTLARRTRGDNARFFAPGEEVPERALTVGVATVMAAREVAIVAFGAAKGEAVRGVVEGPVRAWVPASALQEHERVLVVVDAEAAEGLGGEAREYFRDVEEGAERGGAKL